MTSIKMTAVNIASRKRPILGQAEAQLDLDPVFIGESLYGILECHHGKNGERKWYGRKNIYGFHKEEAPMLEDFIVANNLEPLHKILLPMEKCGSYDSKCLQVMYYLEWN